MLHTLPAPPKPAPKPAPAPGPGPANPTAAARLLAHAVSTLDHDPQVARHCLERLAAMFADDAASAGGPSAGPAARESGPVKGGLASWQVRGVLDHIDRHLGATIGVDALAGVARLSTGHFCRAFKATTGETPHAFIIRRRIGHAQTLMLQTDETLSQIAYACGLTDQAHLSRLFRRVVGASPLIWRRAWQAR